MSKVSEGIAQGLKEMLAHTQGQVELKSNTISSTPPQRFTPEEIRSIRTKLNMSQGFFADVIGVSKKTVESWEYGRGKPSGAASRMLTIASKDPEALRRYGFANW